MTRAVKKALKNNAKIVDERGPGLYYDMKAVVIAKDVKNGYVLLGGLGALGVGQMWCTMQPGDRRKPGYKNAPTRTCPKDER